MKKEVRNLPFSTVLDELLHDEQLPIPLLYRLSDMAPAELEELRGRWAGVADERRRVIARHLADLSEENFAVDFGPVFALCFDDPVAEVRVAGLDGVWDSTDASLVGRITELLQTDDSEEVRVAAAAALAHYVLMVEWGQLPEPISQPIVAALLAEYDNPETAVPVKRAVLEALGAATHPRVAKLIVESYESEDTGLQLSAVFAMGSSADSRWLPTVLAEMESPYAEMRAEAARAAGIIASSDALGALVNLTADEEPDVQEAAIVALGQLGSAEAMEVLARLLEDPDYESLADVIEDALEEISLAEGSFDFLDFEDDDEELELDD